MVCAAHGAYVLFCGRGTPEEKLSVRIEHRCGKLEKGDLKGKAQTLTRRHKACWEEATKADPLLKKKNETLPLTLGVWCWRERKKESGSAK